MVKINLEKLKIIIITEYYITKFFIDMLIYQYLKFWTILYNSSINLQYMVFQTGNLFKKFYQIIGGTVIPATEKQNKHFVIQVDRYGSLYSLPSVS